MELPHRRMPERDAFDQNILAAIRLEQVRTQITSLAEDSLAHGRALGNHFLKQGSRFARAGVSLLPSAAGAPGPRPPIFAISLAIDYTFAGDCDVLLLKGIDKS